MSDFRLLYELSWIGQVSPLSPFDPVCPFGSVSAPARAMVRTAESYEMSLRFPASFAIVPAAMSNRAIWSMRKRHEWLSRPLKKKRIKRATRVRCGLQDAIDRRGGEKSE